MYLPTRTVSTRDETEIQYVKNVTYFNDQTYIALNITTAFYSYFTRETTLLLWNYNGLRMRTKNGFNDDDIYHPLGISFSPDC